MKRIATSIAAVLVCGGTQAAGLVVGTAPAGADTWCPGDYMFAGIPNWDMSVCHEYYWAHKYDLNTPVDLYFEGPPPGPPVAGFCGRDMFTGIPLPC